MSEHSLSTPALQCSDCGGPLSPGSTTTSRNEDGTSGDAQVVRWMCAECKKVYACLRIPRISIENGETRCHWREVWVGGPPDGAVQQEE